MIWNETFTKHLVEDIHLIKHEADPCLFTKTDAKGEINCIASIYIDDAVIGGPSEIVNAIKNKMKARFSIKDLGIAKHVIGIQVEQLSEGTLLSQQSYIEEIIELTGQKDSNTLLTPMSSDDPVYSMVRTPENEGDTLFKKLDADEHHEYREYIGKLMYLMVCTRPDIAFAVNFLARACASPEKQHAYAVLKLVRYLKSTKKLGLFYPALRAGDQVKVDLLGYVDSAFADCKESRKSTGGYVTLLNGSPLTWKSCRQTVVTTSSTEAEYVAACDGTKEVMWLRNLLEGISHPSSTPTILFEDNNSCIAQSENPLHHKRTKHIDVYYHFTRQMVKEGIVKLIKIDTIEQVADMLTKPLGKEIGRAHV